MTPLETSVAQHLLTQLLEEIERVTGELNETRRNLHAAVQARDARTAATEHLYTCQGKGGEYELVGLSRGAGTLRDTISLTVYRDTKTGELYHRELLDFDERMATIDRRAADQLATMRGMADCMDMVRQELIEAGVIEASVPPMMLADAIIAHIGRQTKKP
jgi:hypothetical protein